MKFNPLESGDCYFFCVCVVSVFRYYIVWDKSVHLYGDLCVVIRLFSPVFFSFHSENSSNRKYERLSLIGNHTTNTLEAINKVIRMCKRKSSDINVFVWEGISFWMIVPLH